MMKMMMVIEMMMMMMVVLVVMMVMMMMMMKVTMTTTMMMMMMMCMCMWLLTVWGHIHLFNEVLWHTETQTLFPHANSDTLYPVCYTGHTTPIDARHLIPYHQTPWTWHSSVLKGKMKIVFQTMPVSIYSTNLPLPCDCDYYLSHINILITWSMKVLYLIKSVLQWLAARGSHCQLSLCSG